MNYVPPVAGTDVELKKLDPAVAKNPLIFPPQSVLDNAHQFDPAAVNNQDFRKKFQALMGAVQFLRRRQRAAAPYLLLAPGVGWLAVFFVLPMYYLARTP